MQNRLIVAIFIAVFAVVTGCATTSDGRKIDELTLSLEAQAKWEDQRIYCRNEISDIYEVCHARGAEVRESYIGKPFPLRAINLIVETEAGWTDRQSQAMCTSGAFDAAGVFGGVKKKSENQITEKCLFQADRGEEVALASLKSNEREKALRNSPIYQVILGAALAFLLLWTG